MKQPLIPCISKRLLFIVAVSFLVGVTVTIITGSSSPQALAATTTNNSGYLMLGGADFSGNVDYLGIIEGVRYSAPLHLPQGAKISQITTYYSATNPISFTTYLSVESQRFDVFNPIVASVIASISPTGNQTHTTQSINPPAIDNSQYAYRVSIRTPPPPSPPPGCQVGTIGCLPLTIGGYSTQAINLYLIYHIRIDYTFDSFLPNITR